MKRDIKLKNKRAEFIKNAFNNKTFASEQLRLLAISLDSCRNSEQIVACLSETLFISQATIYKDLSQ